MTALKLCISATDKNSGQHGMKKIFFAAMFLIMITTSCSHGGETIIAASDSALKDAVVSSIAFGSEGVYNSVLKYANQTISEAGAKEGDILIAYNADTMETCCFSVTQDRASLMYEGDYKGAYSKLEYVDEKSYNKWTVMVYRLNKDAKVAIPTDEINELANTILDEYKEKYGQLRVCSIIYILDKSGSEYQYELNSEGKLKLLEYADGSYDIWRDSDDSENYWAKLVCDLTENDASWAVYERDEQCTAAFNEIADTYNSLADAGIALENGSVLVWQNSGNNIAMRYEDGGMYYVQPVDFEAMKGEMQLYDIGSVSGVSNAVEVYIAK